MVARRDDQQKRPGARARRVLVEQNVKSAAAHVFLQRGIANASLGDVAQELGTARTALYHYFKSKDELLVALITECAAEARQILAEAGGDSPSDRVWEAMRRLAAFAIEQPERVLLLDVAAELPPAAERTARKLNRLFFADLEGLIQAGIDSGAFRSVDAGVAAHAIVGSTRSPVWWFNPSGPRDADYVARQIADAALNGLLAGAWKEPPPAIRAAVTQLQSGMEALVDALQPAGRTRKIRRPDKVHAKRPLPTLD